MMVLFLFSVIAVAIDPAMDLTSRLHHLARTFSAFTLACSIYLGEWLLLRHVFVFSWKSMLS